MNCRTTAKNLVEETGVKVSTARLKWVRCRRELRGCSAKRSRLQGNAGQRQKLGICFFFYKEKLNVMH